MLNSLPLPSPSDKLPDIVPPNPALGIIEGFFGKSWSWAARLTYASWLPRHGYGFYIYAPKDDAHLRRQWQLPWPESELIQLKQLAHACRQHGVAFGVGLTPLGAHHDYPSKRDTLLAKLELIEAELQPDILAVLFDDMPSDTPALAKLQLAIAHDVAAHTRASRLIFCPSFYSTDPILEKVFGAMPTAYWDDLGSGLDPHFDLFWTGPKVCSTVYPPEHLAWVAQTLKRKPFLWDNYPVNDGKKASNFLYLRGFEHRPAELSELLAGHAVNPMKQAALSRLPLATLPLSYQLGPNYRADQAWQQVTRAQLGNELTSMLAQDLSLLTEVGLEQLSSRQKSELTKRYSPFTRHEEINELLRWLAGEYIFDPACLTD